MLKKNISLAVVAARKGSKGIKNKNLTKINNEPITKIATRIALSCKKIQKVVFTSDSDKILNTVKNDKNLTKLKRKASLSKSTTPMLPVLKDAVNFFEKTNPIKFKVSNVVIVDPTAPLRKISDLNKSINIFNRKKPDLLISVHEAQHNPYFSMLEKKGKFYKLSKIYNKNPGSRQEVPKVYEVNTIVWIYSRNAIFKEKKRIPKKTLIIKTPLNRSVDIDTKEDIKKIKYYLSKK